MPFYLLFYDFFYNFVQLFWVGYSISRHKCLKQLCLWFMSFPFFFLTTRNENNFRFLFMLAQMGFCVSSLSSFLMTFLSNVYTIKWWNSSFTYFVSWDFFRWWLFWNYTYSVLLIYFFTYFTLFMIKNFLYLFIQNYFVFGVLIRSNDFPFLLKSTIFFYFNLNLFIVSN